MTRLTRFLIIPLLAIAVVLSIPAPAGAQPIATLTDARLKQRVVAFFVIGNSDTIEANRRIGWGIKEKGWANFVTVNVKPVLAWGVRRVELHLPFGTSTADVQMAFDGIPTAREAGGTLDWITNGFAEAWAPVIRGDYTNGEKVEVIAYQGSIRSCKGMQSRVCGLGSPVIDANAAGTPIVGYVTKIDTALGTGTYTDPTGRVLGTVSLVSGERWDNVHIPPRLAYSATGTTAWHERAFESLALPLKAGMSIGFDGGVALQKWHPGYRVIRMLQAQGVRTYIETWPDINSTHWSDANVIIASNTWYSSWFLKSGWPMKRSAMTGEILRMITQPGITVTNADGTITGTTTKTITNADGSKSIVPLTAADTHNGADEVVWSLANGYSVIVSIKPLITQGSTLDGLITAARAAAPR